MELKELYPDGIHREAYDKALEQTLIHGPCLFNQSDMDLWFEVDGFSLKIPAGTRSRITGWAQVRQQMADMHREEWSGIIGCVSRSGFKFANGEIPYIYDAIVLFSPDSARHWSQLYGVPERTLEECIALINGCQLEKAVIIGDDLSFLTRCPSLRSIEVHYPKGAKTGIDYSPLYEMPEIHAVSCSAPVSGVDKKTVIPLDCSRIQGLRKLSVYEQNANHFHLVPTLEELFLSGEKRYKDLQNISCSPNFKRLWTIQSGLRSLNGIGRYPMQQVCLDYMRSLEDLSALSMTAPTLRSLSIEACGKIQDFSFLYDLINLEHLNLMGSNTLPSLDFLRKMPKLKTFVFSMTVEDGDLTPCLDLPYASCCKMKRHYNVKEKDLPKQLDGTGFRLI